MTNEHDLGYIEARPTDEDSATVDVHFGIGDNRVDDAWPKFECVMTRRSVNLSGTDSHTVLALMVLRAIGDGLLKEVACSEALLTLPLGRAHMPTPSSSKTASCKSSEPEGFPGEETHPTAHFLSTEI